MKRTFFILNILLISTGVLFKGLFFDLEQNIFFALISFCAAGYLTAKLFKKEKLTIDKWMTASGLLLLIAVLFSFIMAVYTRGNITSILQLLNYFIVALIITDYFTNSNKKVDLFLVPIVLVGFIVALIGLSGHTGFGSVDILTDTTSGKRINSTFQYANTAGIYFAICFFLAFTAIVKYKYSILRAFFTGIGSILLIALFFTGSRGTYLVFPIVFFMYIVMIPAGYRFWSLGSLACIAVPFAICLKGYNANAAIANYISAFKWLALCFGLSIIGSLFIDLIITPLHNRFIAPFILKYKNLKYISIVTALIAVGVSALPAISFIKTIIPANILTRLTTISLSANTAVYRLDLYRDALALIKRNWLFGYGGGGWPALYQSVQLRFFTARAVHNHFLQVFVESGIIGFLSYLTITLTAFICFIYAYIKTVDKKTKLLITGFFTAYTALTLHSAMDFDLTYSSMSLLWWSFVGVSAAFAHKASKEGGEKSMFAGVSSSVSLYIALILSVGLVLPNAAFATSALYAEKAYTYRENADIPNAILYYEKAAQIDGMNAENYCTLAELYNRMAANSEKQEDMNFWRKKALDAAETSVRYNPNYPYYNYVLTTVYFDAGNPIKAFDQAEKLVSLQPLYNANYEVLARGYMEAGLEYYRQGDIEKAKELITKCSGIDNDVKIKMTQTLNLYKGKALLLKMKFTEAEAIIKSVRAASEKELDMKIECDRLLYIINQQTGRSADNARYKGVLYMGMVEKTQLYIEVTKILKEEVFK